MCVWSMTQKCKITLGNISHNEIYDRVFESRNNALIWLNHQLVKLARSPTIHELYFRIESYNSDNVNRDNLLPF